MTRPLTSHVREQLGRADEAPMWEQLDREQMRMSVEALRDAYPMPDIRLAQFLMETAQGIEQVLADSSDGELRDAIKGYQMSLVALASAVSRKARGKPGI